jgi:uncharacterized protein (DUF433 family)
VSSPADTSIDIGSLIVRTPNVRNGEPHIAGAGMTVKRISGYYKLGLDAEEIAREVPHLSIAQVYAALAYYHSNRHEIDRLLANEEAEHDRLEAEFSNK